MRSRTHVLLRRRVTAALALIVAAPPSAQTHVPGRRQPGQARLGGRRRRCPSDAERQGPRRGFAGWARTSAGLGGTAIGSRGELIYTDTSSTPTAPTTGVNVEPLKPFVGPGSGGATLLAFRQDPEEP
jgi:hypothetical protein